MQAIFTSADVTQVNIAAATGDMGILANHVPSIEPLRPGIVEVIESGNASKKWFGKNKHPCRPLVLFFTRSMFQIKFREVSLPFTQTTS
jgi:F-type H+-transporting ATPase subunit delta